MSDDDNMGAQDPPDKKKEKENAWTEKYGKFADVQYSREIQNDRYVLFELSMKLTSNTKEHISPDHVRNFFNKKVPRALDTIVAKAAGSYSVFFLSKEARDVFNKTSGQISKSWFAMESFPPEEAPFWKPAPTFVSTRIRLLKVPHPPPKLLKML